MNISFEALVDEFLAAYPDACVYLYGSFARGTAGPSSDIDICALMPPNSVVARYDKALDARLSKIAGRQVNSVFCTEVNEWCEEMISTHPTRKTA